MHSASERHRIPPAPLATTAAAPAAGPAGCTGRPAARVGSVSKGIDEDGTIVGTAGSATGEPSGHRWLPDGSSRTMPLPTVDGRKANFFWPDSISNGWVYGRAVFDSPRTRDFASMRYRIVSGTYEKLAVSMSPSIGAANGWILGGTPAGPPVIVAGSRTVPLPRYGKIRDYQVSSFSADGRTAGGYSTGLHDSAGTVPIRCTCR